MTIPPLLRLNYPLDRELVKQEMINVKHRSNDWYNPWNNKRVPDYRMKPHSNEYSDKVISDLGITATPRFYWLAANSTNLQRPHKDYKTLCAVNFIVSDHAAPIIINDVEYYYSAALINVQEYHAVVNGTEERLLLKLSISDTPYEEVYEKLSKTYGIVEG